MLTGDSLSLSKEVFKRIQGLKMGYLKFYCKHYNILSNQKDYTTAVYCYMLSLGDMGKGDFLCLKQEQHGEFKSFDTEREMRTHWAECHKISLEEEFLMLVVPDSGMEPPMVVNMPMLDIPGASGEQVNPPKAKGSSCRANRGEH